MDQKKVSSGLAHGPGETKVRLTNIARRAMRQRGFSPEFSPAVLKETTAAVEVSTEPNTSIRDLRTLPWASIDNDTSLDLDQLSVAQPMAGGAVKILIAIADVDAIVKQDSATDAHAQINTTSVYTAAAVFPMLPEKLSTDLTSLREDEERLALVVEMAVAADGTVSESAVYRAVVRNHAKLAYNAVAAWLDGQAPAPARIAVVAGLDEQLRVQDRVSQSMKKFRHMHGALSLETTEARPVFEGNALTDIQLERTNRAKQLIENFMIAANGVVAKYLAQKGFPSLRRQLRSPERWDKIAALAADLGGHLPAEPSANALEEFLAERRKTEPARFADLSLAVVKLLGRGEYVLEVPGKTQDGHFALATNDYTHSTAPNRRFPDLIAQRLLKAADAGRAVPYSNDQLAQFGRHCTEQETNATKVERHVRKSAAALLLESRVGEVFDAIVTGASEKGTWVQIDHPVVEGKLVNASARLNIGDRLRARLVHTDVELGFIDFARIEGP
ncbi:MAG TPA: RNB domain-containing ribonuclease [Chthoniobacterales bacterium]|nr:RNB domain-containing ribonuclease [Chthoniobacterales bacterium]